MCFVFVNLINLCVQLCELLLSSESSVVMYCTISQSSLVQPEREHIGDIVPLEDSHERYLVNWRVDHEAVFKEWLGLLPLVLAAIADSLSSEKSNPLLGRAYHVPDSRGGWTH